VLLLVQVGSATWDGVGHVDESGACSCWGTGAVAELQLLPSWGFTESLPLTWCRFYGSAHRVAACSLSSLDVACANTPTHPLSAILSYFNKRS
jgi:hypothetical protein